MFKSKSFYFFLTSSTFLSLLIIESIFRQNVPDHIFRPTTVMNIFGEKVNTFARYLGSKLAFISDLYNLLDYLYTLLKKYLPYEDFLNIISSLHKITIKPIYSFFDEYVKYYSQYLNNSNILLGLLGTTTICICIGTLYFNKNLKIKDIFLKLKKNNDLI